MKERSNLRLHGKKRCNDPAGIIHYCHVCSHNYYPWMFVNPYVMWGLHFSLKTFSQNLHDRFSTQFNYRVMKVTQHIYTECTVNYVP